MSIGKNIRKTVVKSVFSGNFKVRKINE